MKFPNNIRLMHATLLYQPKRNRTNAAYIVVIQSRKIITVQLSNWYQLIKINRQLFIN